MGSKFYIAAKYSRRHELRDLVDRLESLGHSSTAQWIHGGEENKDIKGAAMMDDEDVRRCDTMIFMGEPQGSEIRGGGRWFEFGMAHALNKRCIAVLNLEQLPDLGDRIHLPPGHESVFTALPNVKVVTSIQQLVDIL